MKPTIRDSFLGLLALTTLAGCTQDSETFEPVPPDSSRNIYLMEVGAPTKSVYRKGEPLELEVLVGSTGISAEHVTVDFSLIEKAKWQQLENEEAADTVALGDALIENLEPGFTRQSVTLTVPNTLTVAGDYLIVAAVDAGQSVAQDTNFSDNISRGIDESLSHPTVKQITIEDAFVNDLQITDAVIAQGFILLETPTDNALAQNGDDVNAANVQASDVLTGDVLRVADDPRESNVIGHIDIKKLGAESMDARIEVDVIVDGEEFPAFMWKGEGDQWVNEAPYTVPSANETHFIPWDIRLIESQRAALWAAYDPNAEENLATFRFRIIAADDVPDENPNNNIFEVDVPYRFFDPVSDPLDAPEEGTEVVATSTASPLKQVAGPGGDLNRNRAASGRILFDRRFRQSFGDRKKFSAYLDLRSYGDIIGSQGKAVLNSDGRGDVYVLGRGINLFRAFARGDGNVSGGSAYYRGYMKVFGRTYLDQSASTSSGFSRSWSLSWSEERTLGSARFFAGPIPISVSGGVRGSLGFGAALSFSGGKVVATGDIFSVRMSGFARGGVDVGFASGGVGASLLVLNEKLSVSGVADLSQVGRRRVAMSLVANNRLKAIQGEFYLFARYPVYRFCCSIRTQESRLTLYRTGALYNKNWKLLNHYRLVTF